jgi:predicted ATPase
MAWRGSWQGCLIGRRDLRVLATSRERLSIPCEVLFVVPPLPLDAAVALFAERASAVGTAWPASYEAADGVLAEICRRLDGLPLAIELAAARTRHLSVAEIAHRLDRRLDLLTTGPRTAVARQRTLRAVIEWSYALLAESERELFARLAVFEGGFTLQAAEAIHDRREPSTIELPAGLVDKSMVVASSTANGGLRYRLLETVREYASEQLLAYAKLESVRRAHCQYFVEFAAAAEVGLLSSEYRSWLANLQLELPNLRAAHDGAIAAGHCNDALRIASSLWWFWGSTERQREGRQWLEEAMRVPDSEIEPSVRARALTVLGYIAGQQLDFIRASAVGEEALSLSTMLGDVVGIASAKQALGVTLEGAGYHARSKALLAEARAVWDAYGMHQRVATSDIVTCVQALADGDLSLVDSTSQEVLRRCAFIDYDPYRCWGHLIRARLEEARHDLPTAGRECANALSAARRLGLAHFISFALIQTGHIAALADDLVAAESLLTEEIGVADSAGAGWFAALARVELSCVLEQQGDQIAAETLRTQVIEWGNRPIAGSGRVTFFRRLGGDPVARATARCAAPPIEY